MNKNMETLSELFLAEPKKKKRRSAKVVNLNESFAPTDLKELIKNAGTNN